MTLDCPNDRYINDTAICQAVAGMLGRVGITVDLNAQSRSVHFGQVLGQDTSFYLLGWTPGNLDAIDVLKPVMHSRGDGAGFFNIGGYANDRVDALVKAIEVETDPDARAGMNGEALSVHREEVGHIPLHRQHVSWGCATVSPSTSVLMVYCHYGGCAWSSGHRPEIVPGMSAIVLFCLPLRR